MCVCGFFFFLIDLFFYNFFNVCYFVFGPIDHIIGMGKIYIRYVRFPF